LENAVLSLPEGQGKMVWLIDFTGWTMANAVPINTARETTNILQNHYPERLAVAFLFNPPKVFEAFWKVKGSQSSKQKYGVDREMFLCSFVQVK
jgi:hypothetical protein